MSATMRVRFFAEEGVTWCLWAEEDDPGQLEQDLPLPDDLRRRMREWIDEFTTRTHYGLPGPWTEELRADFKDRGYLLSQEVQEAIGPNYRIAYLG